MRSDKRILRLKGKVQHYAWGGYDYIPRLLGISNPGHKTCAEYWMGAHPGAPSEVTVNGEDTSLAALIAKDPSGYIGNAVFKDFGELPYLFKILDVRDMLSIQVHPTKEEAVEGFNAEQAAGIPLNAPNRNYKDKNHKPEVMVALSEFWLLHGFKTEKELEQVLTSVPEFRFLLPVFSGGNYFELYKTVMELPPDKVDEILLPLVKRQMEQQPRPLPKEPGFWVNKLFNEAPSFENIDRGIFSIYFFNIVELRPGEAIFQSAGIPHAYLLGQNAELMANSDNVLRGGLTPKHVDVPELLKHTRFEGIKPEILRGERLETGELNYKCPVKDFGICAVKLEDGSTYRGVANSAEIYIVIEGEVRADDAVEQFTRGDSFYVLPGTEYTLGGRKSALLYKAFVP